MIEIGLILGINVAGLAFAVLLARWVRERDAGSAESRRLLGAVRRAAESFLWREYRLVAATTLGLGLLAFAAHGYLAHAGRPGGSAEAAFWTAIALAVGAVLTCAVAHVSAVHALDASGRTVAAARLGLDRAMTIAVRAGGAAALLVQALCSIGMLSLAGLVFAMKGGFALRVDQAAPLALHVATLIPGFAVGAAVAALILQRGGATFHVASDLGADMAGERDAGLEHDDARNPAVVADLVGDRVGLAATRAADLFASSAIAGAATLYIAASTFARHHGDLVGVLALVTLPFVVQAFGIVACAFGVMTVRSDELGEPDAALWRGHATTIVIVLGGVAGATLWLLGDIWWFRFFIAGALGPIAAATSAYAARFRAERRFSPLRDVLDSLRLGDPAAVAHGLGSGLQAAALPVLVMGAAVVSAWQLGASSGLADGGLVATTTLLMAMLAAAPYVLAIDTFAPIADSARGVVAMNPSLMSGEALRRTGRLDDAGVGATCVAQTYLLIVGCSSALLVAAVLPLAAVIAAGAPSPSSPAVVWSGAFGAAVVLAYAGSAMRVAMRGARGVAIEVERQLRGFPRERGLAKVPRDYTPSYRSCIDMTARAALDGVMVPVALVIATPLALALLLYFAYRTSNPSLPSEALTSFVTVAAVTGFATALVADGARSTLVAARRAARPRGSVSGFSASISGDAIADLLGNAAGPAAHLLVKLTAIACLAIAPFLT